MIFTIIVLFCYIVYNFCQTFINTYYDVIVMKSTHKYVALFVGLALIVSVGSSYALMQGNQSTRGIQADSMKTMGHIALTVYGPDGAIKAYRQSDNIVVQNGDNATVNKMFGVSRNTNNPTVGVFTAVAVGVGTSGPTVQDNDLSASGQKGHKVLATTDIVSTLTHGNVKLTATFNPGKITNSTTQAITEAGLFDNTSSNLGANGTSVNMFARQTFSAINVGTADTLTVTWTININ